MEEGKDIAKGKEWSGRPVDTLIEVGQPGYNERSSGFGKLPADVRQMIWNFAIPTSNSKVIILDTPCRIKTPELACNNLFGICRESRRVALDALAAEDERNLGFDLQNAFVGIDFDKDIFQILKHDWLNNLDNGVVLDIARKARRLILPLKLFNACWWPTMDMPPEMAPLSRSDSHPLPILYNYLTLPSGNGFAGASRTFCHLQELIVILDDGDELFKDIMRTKALQSSDPNLYQKLCRYSRGKNHRLHSRVRPYLRSEDWKLDYATEVLAGMRTKVRNALSRSSSRWFHHWRPQQAIKSSGAWKMAKTPMLSVWYPDNGELVVTDRGDMDNEGEFKKDGQGRPWATFVLPTVRMEYPNGYMLKKIFCQVCEQTSSQ